MTKILQKDINYYEYQFIPSQNGTFKKPQDLSKCNIPKNILNTFKKEFDLSIDSEIIHEKITYYIPDNFYSFNRLSQQISKLISSHNNQIEKCLNVAKSILWILPKMDINLTKTFIDEHNHILQFYQIITKEEIKPIEIDDTNTNLWSLSDQYINAFLMNKIIEQKNISNCSKAFGISENEFIKYLNDWYTAIKNKLTNDKEHVYLIQNYQPQQPQKQTLFTPYLYIPNKKSEFTPASKIRKCTKELIIKELYTFSEMFENESFESILIHDQIQYKAEETNLKELCSNLDKILQSNYNTYSKLGDITKIITNEIDVNDDIKEFIKNFYDKCEYLNNKVLKVNNNMKEEEKERREREEREKQEQGINESDNENDEDQENQPSFVDISNYFKSSKNFLPNIIDKIINFKDLQISKLQKQVNSLENENKDLKKQISDLQSRSPNQNMNISQESLNMLNIINNNPLLKSFIQTSPQNMINSQLFLQQLIPTYFQQFASLSIQQIYQSPLFNLLPQNIQNIVQTRATVQPNYIVNSFLRKKNEYNYDCQKYLYNYLNNLNAFVVKIYSLDEETFKPIDNPMDYDISVEFTSGYEYHIIVRSTNDSLSSSSGIPLVLKNIQIGLFKGDEKDDNQTFETILALFWNADKPSIDNCIFLAKSDFCSTLDKQVNSSTIQNTENGSIPIQINSDSDNPPQADLIDDKKGKKGLENAMKSKVELEKKSPTKAKSKSSIIKENKYQPPKKRAASSSRNVKKPK